MEKEDVIKTEITLAIESLEISEESDPSIGCPIFTNQDEIVDRIYEYVKKLIDYDKN
ncbi:MAG TPA: hypothetical protein VGZ90_13645 [Puia sp.]|jgi:hypothetical protein|nr:hypothetical protein [Puia sp.]